MSQTIPLQGELPLSVSTQASFLQLQKNWSILSVSAAVSFHLDCPFCSLIIAVLGVALYGPASQKINALKHYQLLFV